MALSDALTSSNTFSHTIASIKMIGRRVAGSLGEIKRFIFPLALETP